MSRAAVPPYVVITAKIPLELMAKIEAARGRCCTTRSKLVCRILEKWAHDTKQQPATNEMRRLLKDRREKAEEALWT